jgi:hypothetical protein
VKDTEHATPLQVLAMLFEMDANLGTEASLVHRRRVDADGAPLRGTLVPGHLARVSIDGEPLTFVSFEALVTDGWRFDLIPAGGEDDKKDPA